jgi:hypothetical protein
VLSLVTTEEDNEYVYEQDLPRAPLRAGFVYAQPLESRRAACFASSAETKDLDGLDVPRLSVEADVLCRSSRDWVYTISLPAFASMAWSIP